MIVKLLALSMMLWGEGIAEPGAEKVAGNQLSGRMVYQGIREGKGSPPEFVLKRLVEESHPGIKNLICITPELFTGAQPIGKEGFSTLRKLGVKTVVSVDGAFPQIQTASAKGLTYVHIPISYGKIPENALLSMLHVELVLEKPIFVHCHHGKHRGPSAAALLAMMSGACGKGDAMTILQLCGTNQKYSGLWDSVRNYEAPTQRILLPSLNSRENIDPATASMVRLGEVMDNLSVLQKAGGKVDSGLSVGEVTELTVLLHEELREFKRLASSDRPAEFSRYLDDILKSSKILVKVLDVRDVDRVSILMKDIRQNCSSCHQKFRN